LAVVELGWVTLIVLYGVSGLYFLDLTFFFWAAMLFIFSAVEVILGFLAFLLFNKHRGSLDVIKCGFLRAYVLCGLRGFSGGLLFVFIGRLLRGFVVPLATALVGGVWFDATQTGA